MLPSSPEADTRLDGTGRASLNPRIGSIDLKMWQEVRIPWVLLFGIAISAAMKQYETIGYVTLVRPPCFVAAVSLQGHAHTTPRSLSQNMAFMVLATGLCVFASCSRHRSLCSSRRQQTSTLAQRARSASPRLLTCEQNSRSSSTLFLTALLRIYEKDGAAFSTAALRRHSRAGADHQALPFRLYAVVLELCRSVSASSSCLPSVHC